MVASETLPGGPGLFEEAVHPASGMRSFVQTGVFANSEACVATANIANTSGNWAVLIVDNTVGSGKPVPQGTSSVTGLSSTFSGTQTLYRSRLPFPCTPCITYRQTNGAPNNTQVFSVRIYGYDQFGVYQMEQLNNLTTATTVAMGTPTESYTRKTRVWCSKVFSAVTRIEYNCNNTQGVSDWLDVGVAWNFDMLNTVCEPYTNYIARENQGIGTPLRVTPYGPSTPLIAPELYAIELTNLTPQVWPITQIPISNPTTLNIGNGTAGGANLPLALPGTTTLVSYTAANPTVLTVNAAVTSIGFTAGQRFRVRISGEVGTPGINGEWIATAISATTFSIPVNVTVAGSLAAMWVYTPPLYGAKFSAATDPNAYEPVLVLVNGNTPTLINGYHHAKIASNWSLTVPINTTAAGTSGSVQLLNPPAAVVHPYNTSLVGANQLGGFRIGTNATGYTGTPHKWALVRSVGSSLQPNGTPLIPTDTPYIDAALVFPQFPWFYTDRVAFKAYYRTMRGTVRGTNATRSYAT